MTHEAFQSHAVKRNQDYVEYCPHQTYPSLHQREYGQHSKNQSESLGYLGLFVHKELSRIGWLGTEENNGSVLGLERQCLLTHFGWEGLDSNQDTQSQSLVKI